MMTTAVAPKLATKGWSVADAVAYVVKRCRSLSKPPRLVVADELAFLWPRLREPAMKELVMIGLMSRAGSVFKDTRSGEISAERLGWTVRPRLEGAEVFVERLNLALADRFVNGLDASAADFRRAATLDRTHAAGLVHGAEGKEAIADFLDGHHVRCARELPKKGAELNSLVESYWLGTLDD